MPVGPKRAANSMAQPLITVFTPTYNRARTLPRVYDSLRKQTLTDFEWLIVDDGSTDRTSDLVAEWIAERALTIRYVAQENAGKHVCANIAVRRARGRYIATLDSDDWFVPNALQTFARVWASIPASEYHSFAAVVGLCASPSGAIVGNRFPEDVLDATSIELATAYRVWGDKAGCGRVDVDSEFPFPVFEGERLVVEGIVYRRMSRRYRMRCINEVVTIKDYQPDGLSANARELYIANPLTARLYFVEALRDCGLRQPWECLRYSSNVVRYSLHANEGLRGASQHLPKWGIFIGAPLGLALYVRDRLRARVSATAAAA
jgi:glycosyltransferase involved in cell wall biosynthesis